MYFALVLLLVCQVSFSYGDIKYFLDNHCEKQETWGDVSDCDTDMSEPLRKAITKCIEDNKIETVSGEPLICSSMRSFTKDPEVAVKMQECISKEEETAAEGTTPDDAKEAKFEFCMSYLTNDDGWMKLCHKDADDALYEKIQKCETENAYYKDIIKPCWKEETIPKLPLICYRRDHTHEEVAHCIHEKTEEDPNDNDIEDMGKLTECLREVVTGN